jgi:hypothetical protein
MTSDRTTEHHPSDLELAAWVDEPGIARADIGGHLGACARCQDRVAELEATRAAIAQDPPLPSEAEFAAQRGRILEAIEGAPREGGGRVVRRLGWVVPLAAAATIAAIVLVDRSDRTVPGTLSGTVAAEAESAAEEAAELVMDDETLDAALSADEGLTPPAAIERSASIEAEFALLPEAEQSAVLLELERSEFGI